MDEIGRSVAGRVDEGSAKNYSKTDLELNVKSCVWKIDLVVDLAMIWHIFWHDICRFYNDVVGWRGVSAIGSLEATHPAGMTSSISTIAVTDDMGRQARRSPVL